MGFLFMLRCFGGWLDSEFGMPCAIFLFFYFFIYYLLFFYTKFKKTFSLYYPPATSKVPTTTTTSYSGFWFIVWLPKYYFMGFLFLFCVYSIRVRVGIYTLFIC